MMPFMYEVICFDLDDTLFKEMDYLKSAYHEIAIYATNIAKGRGVDFVPEEKAYNVMLEAYRQEGNAFTALNEFLGLEVPITDYLSIYRNHIPNIHLSEEVEMMLCQLNADGYVLGLITDGRSVQQRHKIKALGLERFFAAEDIIISEEFGSGKPSEANYRYFMERYPKVAQLVYVGDNLRKDFITPKRLGWKTFCLLDDGRNIHRQDFSCPEEFQPNIKIAALNELLSVLTLCPPSQKNNKNFHF